MPVIGGAKLDLQPPARDGALGGSKAGHGSGHYRPSPGATARDNVFPKSWKRQGRGGGGGPPPGGGAAGGGGPPPGRGPLARAVGPPLAPSLRFCRSVPELPSHAEHLGVVRIVEPRHVLLLLLRGDGVAQVPERGEPHDLEGEKSLPEGD